MRNIVVPLLMAAFLFVSCGGGSGGKETGKTEKTDKKKSGEKSEKPDKPAKKPDPPAPKIDIPGAASRLASEDPLERDTAIRELAFAGSSCTEKMAGLVEAGDEPARSAALVVLSRTGDKAARAALEKALDESTTAEEAIYALLALGAVGEDSSVPKIKEYLGYKAPARFPASADWMVEKGRETEEGLVRNQAAESLAMLGDYSGMPVLIENLGNNGWVRKDSLIRLRRITGCKVDFGYSMGDGRPAREAAIARWKKWWKDNAATFKPDWTDSPAIYDVDKRGK